MINLLRVQRIRVTFIMMFHVITSQVVKAVVQASFKSEVPVDVSDIQLTSKLVVYL